MLKQLLEKRAKLGADIKKMAEIAQERAFTAEEQTNWNKLNSDFDELDRRIAALQRSQRVATTLGDRAGDDDEAGGEGGEDDDEDAAHEGRDRGRGERRGSRAGREDVDHRDTLERQNRGNTPTEEERAIGLAAWFRAQSDLDVTQEQEDIARRCGISIWRRSIDIRLPREAPRSLKRAYEMYGEDGRETRALSALVADSGGVLVPGTLLSTLEVALLQFGGIRQVAEVIRTQRGESMGWPGVNDTGNSGEIVGENASVGEQDVSFNDTRWSAYKFSSKMVKVPSELLEDAIIDLPSVLGAMLGERIGRIQNTRMTTGTGSGQPYGIVNRAFLGVTAASATAITANELIDFQHSVDPAYRLNGKWMMHDLIMAMLRKLKDGTGAYIWQAGNIAQGVPQTLLGQPVVINQDMASAAASGAKTVLYGDLSKYKIRDVGTIRIRRLVERYADTDQEGFIAFLRGDGNLLDAGTHPVKYLVHP